MIKVLIVEDEDLAANRLGKALRELDSDIDIIGRTTSVEETKVFLETHEIDLFFLDINLSDGYSFEIFKNDQANLTPVIFTTAYSEFAIKSFELNSVSYLLKPINKKQLAEAFDKFKRLHYVDSSLNKVDYSDLLDSLMLKQKKRFLIKVNTKLHAINSKDIAYFFSEDKLSFIMLWSGKLFPIEKSLKAIEGELHSNSFFRINKRYLVHLDAIEQMYYTSKSKIKIELKPSNKNDTSPIFVAIEKIGKFKKWLSL
ncbi:LytR/AlgR family response regulator transcription factor [Aquimarina agarilytica]|uniref:LytR/AlgR family response regulator transcription factor n=1 Tax=Aquimarina agarilytica TaxID=1087449 RepID=UPI000287CAB0|nr:LytTR family DNA-binding domain-containing protein [Aquimarina agarilytica]